MSREITAKNYFEYIGTIQTVNLFYAEKETEYLYILVLTSTLSDFKNLVSEKIPSERYSDKLEDWQMYQHEKICEVLEDFKKKSTISLMVSFLAKNHHSEVEDLDGKIEPLTKKFVLIADAFSLQFDENSKIAKLFDSKDKNKIGGCLVPICTTLSEEQTKFAKEQTKSVFERLTKGVETEFYKSYTYTELDIPNKTHFFRRLANIAYLKGITEKETMLIFESISKKYDNPPKE